jgi:hypothetical protein
MDAPNQFYSLSISLLFSHLFSIIILFYNSRLFKLTIFLFFDVKIVLQNFQRKQKRNVTFNSED